MRLNLISQVRARGLQLAVLAVARPCDPRPEVLHAAPRSNTATDVLQHVGARLRSDLKSASTSEVTTAATVLKKEAFGARKERKAHSYTSRNEDRRRRRRRKRQPTVKMIPLLEKPIANENGLNTFERWQKKLQRYNLTQLMKLHRDRTRVRIALEYSSNTLHTSCCGTCLRASPVLSSSLGNKFQK